MHNNEHLDKNLENPLMKEVIAALPSTKEIYDEELSEDMEIEIARQSHPSNSTTLEVQNLSVNDFSIVSSTTSNDSLGNDSLEVNSPSSVASVTSVSQVATNENASDENDESVPSTSTGPNTKSDDSKSRKAELSRVAKIQLRSSKAAGKELGPLKVFNSPKEILHVDFAELIVEREI